MNAKERITEILKTYTKKHNISASSVILEEYAEELVRQGAIIPPCKVGQTVYVTFSNFYAEYKVSEFIYDGTFIWAKLINEEYEPQNRKILRCFSFDINKTIFLDEKEASLKSKGAWEVVFLHYNNGEEEKLITDILCIDIIDGNNPAIVTLRNGKELRIRLDRIETILNDDIKEREG